MPESLPQWTSAALAESRLRSLNKVTTCSHRIWIKVFTFLASKAFNHALQQVVSCSRTVRLDLGILLDDHKAICETDHQEGLLAAALQQALDRPVRSYQSMGSFLLCRN